MKAIYEEGQGRDYYLTEGVDFEYGNAEELHGHPKYNTRIKLISKQSGQSDLHIHYTRSDREDLSSHPEEMFGEVLIDAITYEVHLANEKLNRAFGLGLFKKEIGKFLSEIKHLFSHGWLPNKIHLREKPVISLSAIWQKTHLGRLRHPR